MGVPQGPGAAAVLTSQRADPEIRASELPADAARIALANGKVSLVVLPGENGAPPTYWFDPTREESRVARLVTDASLQRAAGRGDPLRPGKRELTEKGSRFIDFLLPGLLAQTIAMAGVSNGVNLNTDDEKGVYDRYSSLPIARAVHLADAVLADMARYDLL